MPDIQLQRSSGVRLIPAWFIQRAGAPLQAAGPLCGFLCPSPLRRPEGHRCAGFQPNCASAHLCISTCLLVFALSFIPEKMAATKKGSRPCEHLKGGIRRIYARWGVLSIGETRRPLGRSSINWIQPDFHKNSLDQTLLTVWGRRNRSGGEGLWWGGIYEKYTRTHTHVRVRKTGYSRYSWKQKKKSLQTLKVS